MGPSVFWCLSQQGLQFNSWAMKTRLTSVSLLKPIILAFFSVWATKFSSFSFSAIILEQRKMQPQRFSVRSLVQ